jgi:c(7)-type cytochrome triheme protein
MSRLLLAVLALLATLSGAVSLTACHPQGGLMSDLFVPLPPSGPIQNLPRHPPPPKVVPIVIVQEEVIKPPDIDWAGIYANLPRDKKGKVDWMRALDEKTITPKPGIGEDAVGAKTKDGDIEFFNTGTPEKTATFRHATHTQWLNCKNCHPAVFKKSDENVQFTHDDMEAGKYCGACHFKVVIVQSGCTGCHVKKKPA